MEIDGWEFGVPAQRGAEPACSYDQQELTELAGRALRVLLARQPCSPAHLRLALLGSTAAAVHSSSNSRSKCLLELAVAELLEQGLVVRQGFGPLATLSVPDIALPRAEALAYSEFPDEGQLPLYSSAYSSAAAPGGHALLGGGGRAGAGCHPGGLNRLRRHSSPRQFGHRGMAGVEKASGGRRGSGKRSVGEDISNQLVKKMRVQDGCGPFGRSPAAACDGGCGHPFSPGGCSAMAMSP